ncbi:TetR/AcrR family transcriptional regulator [Streptomyces sp. AC536]|uniref:TetR/AcrR family transcriptional regulator n=1 Tax=Streptomyces buecherae TaxID=2763006 RepID=UPI00164D7B85|nr:TetR/AcrR family transcriptional regulator [Streptomyces buecherae]MBC3986768.1 TetR/AcrR family transcriptional regulator [Streptomyces buecherae]QNJ43789.1 TetR/AcrR family transcriptional regulator [Streptomyces buecherae]
MARPRDPQRRTELLDAIIEYLAEHGLVGLSMRPLAQALGHSTRVLTHHFRDKDDLVNAVLTRLDERQRDRLSAFPGWAEGRSLGAVVRASWDWHLTDDYLPVIRLLHEIEGLAAGGRLPGSQVPAMLTQRTLFVADALRAHGVPTETAERRATLLNAAYAGLQIDYLTTGDETRVRAALEDLIALADAWTRP